MAYHVLLSPHLRRNGVDVVIKRQGDVTRRLWQQVGHHCVAVLIQVVV